jgi:hypothetical protein
LGWRGAHSGRDGFRDTNLCVPSSFSMKQLTEKRKALAAKMLAQKIGYLKIDLFELPTESFRAHRIIRPNNQLFVIQQGVVEIWHTAQDMFVTSLEAGSVFGELPLLGQTMLDCRAIAGPRGVTVGVMDVSLVTEWANSNPISILQELGPHLAYVEAEHYRASFQTVESRLAGLLLKLAGEESEVSGFTQGDLAAQLATYRETVTIALCNCI